LRFDGNYVPLEPPEQPKSSVGAWFVALSFPLPGYPLGELLTGPETRVREQAVPGQSP